MNSSILDTIMNDIKIAMKSKNKETLVTLRTLHSEIKNVAINKRKEITDGDVISVISKGIKQRQDAMEQYKTAQRFDLVEKEKNQIAVYEVYQPKQLNRAEIEQIVDQVLTGFNAPSKKNIGMVMKKIMPLLKGKADGTIINEVVNDKLE